MYNPYMNLISISILQIILYNIRKKISIFVYVSVLPVHDSMFANFVLNVGLSQLVELPTRLANILDLLMVSDPLAVFDA